MSTITAADRRLLRALANKNAARLGLRVAGAEPVTLTVRDTA